ncbi:hypothetical protein JW752_02395 [Candidatus Peregrinibacteria bacterium]|nr:hypothetical protein [Candidatus Peregrinibacteria bacterium]
MTNSSRQIIYVEIDEEVTSIFDRIKNIQKKEIWLVVPRKGVLFQSAVNLKILKKKLSEQKKKLIIVTTDRNGQHLAERSGLPVMSRVEVEKTEAPSDETPQMKIQPIQARPNIIPEEETPKRFSEKKISIRELIQEFRLKDRKHKTSSESPVSSFHFVRPSRKFLMLILIASVGLFMLIGYIALPSATVYIRPKFDNIDFTVNVILADKRKNQTLLRENQPHVIASEVVSTTTKQTKIFNTASKEFDGKNATGKIKIVNTSDDPWDLKEGTRFQTEDGLVFRIPKGVVVPPRERDEAGNASPGTLVSYTEADPFDIYGEPIGGRGNIPPARFIIPGLSKYNQRLIWGESEEAMAGGVTSYRFVVTGDDIRAAEKQIENNLILMAKEDLRTYIDEVNKLNQSRLVLLDDSRYLKIKLTDLRYSEDLEGSYQEKFEVFAKIEAEGVAFDAEQLFTVLKKELSTRTHPDMRLRENSLTQDNITYEVIDEDELSGQIKITATIVGIEEFDIDSSTVAGARFGTRVKEKILGLSIEEAENLVGNFSEVDAVEIKTWPLWIDKVPRVPEGIEIKVMKN